MAFNAGMTKRTRMVIGLVTAISVAGTLSWMTKEPSDPVCEGRTLSQWLEACADLLGQSTVQFVRVKADEALRRIGTNAILTLLGIIRAKYPPPGHPAQTAGDRR